MKNPALTVLKLIIVGGCIILAASSLVAGAHFAGTGQYVTAGLFAIVAVVCAVIMAFVSAATPR